MLELFITGIEENHNKKFITAGLAATMQGLGYSTGVYKPVATGAKLINGIFQSPEIAFVKFMDPYIKTYISYLLSGTENPLVAAVSEGRRIDPVEIIQDYQSILNINEITLIEGTDGLSTPLGKDFLEEHLIKSLNLPLLFVVSPKRNSVNNVIMAINHAVSADIEVRGVVINDYPENTKDTNIKYLPRMIEEYTETKVLGVLSTMHVNINPDELISHILTSMDIEAILKMKIAKLEL